MIKKLKLDFKNSNCIDNFYSQSGQDLFVLSCLDGKTDGIFLDLGCRHPIEINNTFLLENKFNWKGISFDIDKQMIDLFSCRKTFSRCHDARKVDFNELYSLFNTKHFDYLSLDLEPASVTDECLQNIPFKDIEFSLITYEHDFYRFGEKYRTNSRNLLNSYGYLRICSDVSNNEMVYEDWYYNPKYISYDKIKFLESHEKQDWQKILFQ
jgi:hypothetical protein